MSKFSINSDSDSIVIIPLGGCGNIGKNMTLYYYKKTWIMVDCGLSFAEERIMPGVDLIIPDVSFIRDNKIKIDAIIITHAHEDHIGAISYYSDQIQCPIYANKFAINFLKLRMRDKNRNIEKLNTIEMKDEEFKIGSFKIHPIFITHSIPEMSGLFIIADKKKIFHTGDWKLDESPVISEKTNLEKIKKISENGIDLLLCDSTNVFSEGRAKSEGELEGSLYDLLKGKKGMILATLFASNVARLKTFSNVANKLGRVIAISGLSLTKIISIAKKSGYLLDENFIEAKEAMKMERSKVLMLCTGCQGEPLASTAKISNNSHPIIKLHEHDTVLFSSKIIPGNEKKIGATLNRFADRDIEVISEQDHFVHVSGHPKQDEIRELYSILKPKFAIPIHGESVHLRFHCDLIEKEKLAEKALFVRDGDVVVLGNGLSKSGKVNSDYLGVDGNVLLKPSSTAIKERRLLKNHGIIFISIAISRVERKISDFKYEIVGLLNEDREIQKILNNIFYNLEKILNKNILHLSTAKDKILKKDEESIKSSIRDIVKNNLSKEINLNFAKEPLIRSLVHFY